MNHRTRLGIIKKMGNKPNGIAGDHQPVGINVIVEISVLGIPNPALRQIQVPGQNRPLISLPGIAVNVPVLTVHIDVSDHRVGRQHVDGLGNIDVVAHVVFQSGSRQIEPVNECLQIIVVFRLTILFLDAGITGVPLVLVQAIAVDLIHRAIRIQAGPLQIDVIPVFYEVRRTKELAILLHPDSKGKVRVNPRLPHDLPGQRMTHLRLVSPVRQ